MLSGTTTHTPINLVYFLEAATSGIPGARNPSRWTFFSICGVDGNGHNANCGAIVPALPFDPTNHHDFGTTKGVPEGFIGTHKFYYLSRFMFAFYLIALLMGIWTLLLGVLALCTRIGAYLSSFNASIALFFQALAAALMTAWTIQGRNAFRKGNLDAHIGVKAMAFTWAAAACFLLATIMFCAGGSGRRNKTEYVETRRSRRSFFGRRRHTRNSGIKEEYA